MVLNLELHAEFRDYSIVKIGTIVLDDPFMDAISTYKVIFNEPIHNILGNGSKRECFNPLRKVINSDKDERCPLEVVGLISPIISITHITNGQGAVKTFKGTRCTCTLSA